MTQPTFDQLRAQLDDAEQTHIANGWKVGAITEDLNRAIQEQIKSRRILLALHRQMIEWHKENEATHA
jgi:hypothetical protein